MASWEAPRPSHQPSNVDLDTFKDPAAASRLPRVLAHVFRHSDRGTDQMPTGNEIREFARLYAGMTPGRWRPMKRGSPSTV